MVSDRFGPLFGLRRNPIALPGPESIGKPTFIPFVYANGNADNAPFIQWRGFMKTGVAIALSALALSGCASIFSGTTQEVGIRTTPGARFTVTNGYGSQVATGESPASLELKRGTGYFSPQSYRIQLSKAGYKARTVDLQPGINPWYFGNLLLGGVVGMVIVDPLTGAMFRFSPEELEIPLDPNGEDLLALEAEEATTQNSRNFPISRSDYAAREKARQLNCTPMGNPAVADVNTDQEILTFNCREGRQLILRCQYGNGCAAN